MSFGKNAILLGFSSAAVLALAIGCSQSSDDGDSSSAGDTQGDAAVDAAPAVDAGPLPEQTVVISQVYGGGGNKGAAFQNDYVELFNRGNATVGLKGLSLQYTGATKAFASNNPVLNLPDVQLDPGHYFLVQLAGTVGDGGVVGAPLTGADYVATQPLELINLSATDGKIALVDTASLLNNCGAAGSPCDEHAFHDLVGYGNVSQSDGAPVAELNSTEAAIRKLGGCMAFHNNATDFDANVAAPRNGQTTPSPECDTVDAGAPPAPPSADAGASDAGSTTTTDAGSKSTKDAGTYQKDAGSKSKGGTTANGGDDTGVEDPSGTNGDGSDDPTGTHPSTSNDGLTPPIMPATSPKCSAVPGGNTSSTGFGALFGVALALGALRRRRG